MSTIERRKAFLIQQGKDFGDAHFDPELDLVVYRGQHAIRESLWYALGLLNEVDPEAHRRACRIVRRGIATQEIDPSNRWYGVMKTSWEEETYSDINGVAFNGATFAGIYHHYRDRLDPVTEEQVRSALGRSLEAIRRRDDPVGHMNMALSSSLSLIIGGQDLGNEELRILGEKKLFGWIEYTNLAGGPRDYNNLASGGIALSSLAEIANFAKEPEVRLRARASEARLWLHLATHFHPATHQLAGPHSRAYHEEITFNPSSTKGCLYVLLGDEALMGELKSDQDILSGIVVGMRTFHCPDPIKRIFLRKTFPYMACEKTDAEPQIRFGLSEAGQLEVDHRRGEFRVVKTGRLNASGGRRVTDTTCYMRASYALGTVNQQTVDCHRHNLILYYSIGKNSLKPGSFRVVHGNFRGSEEKRHPLHHQANFISAQNRNRAIVLHTCPPVRTEAITCLGAFLKFPEKVEGLNIGERKVVRLPVEVPESAWVFLSDGGVYIGIRPLARTAFGRSSAARIERGDDALYLNMHNYAGRSRSFPAERMGTLRNGYLFEVADRREVKTFEAFRSRVSRTKVEDRTTSGVRSVLWGSGGDSLFLEVETGREVTATRSFNGQPYIPPSLDTPNAAQSSSGQIKIGNANLSWTGGIPLVLISEAKETCVINPSTGTGNVTLRIPGATVWVGAMSPGHIIVEDGRVIRITLNLSPTTGPVNVETDGREHEIVRKVVH